MEVRVARWEATHPRWQEWVAFARALDETRGVLDEEGAALPDAHYLAGMVGERLAGLLMFVVQPIGPEMDVPVVLGVHGRPLTESKIRLFHVLPRDRGRGLGTRLQQEAIRWARRLDCYQIRSRSEMTKRATYRIKLRLGFGMHPAVRTFRDGRRSAGVYWVMALQHAGPNEGAICDGQ